jgi:hypothetical protein
MRAKATFILHTPPPPAICNTFRRKIISSHPTDLRPVYCKSGSSLSLTNSAVHHHHTDFSIRRAMAKFQFSPSF